MAAKKKLPANTVKVRVSLTVTLTMYKFSAFILYNWSYKTLHHLIGPMNDAVLLKTMVLCHQGNKYIYTKKTSNLNECYS